MEKITGIAVILDREHLLAAQAYSPRLLEELEYENVNVETGSAKYPLREGEQTAGFIPLILSSDTHLTERDANSSVVEYSGLNGLVDAICFSLSEWGKCSGYGHKVYKSEVKGAEPHVRVRPFAENGPHADAYQRRLDALAIELGRAVGGYLATKKQGIRK